MSGSTSRIGEPEAIAAAALRQLRQERLARHAVDAHVAGQDFDVHRQMRADLKGQRPCVLWFTGLSGAGKSTLAHLVDARLTASGRHTCVLDGGHLRRGLNCDLGFTDMDRVENIRRVIEVAHLMADAGLIVLVSLTSPFRADREMARARIGEGRFVEVFVDAPLSVVESRDPKGLYRKARRGEMANFTGVHVPYETPEWPEIHVETASVTANAAADQILAYLSTSGALDAR